MGYPISTLLSSKTTRGGENSGHRSQHNNEDDGIDDGVDTVHRPSYRRKFVRKTGLIKSWTNWGPNLLLHKTTADLPTRDAWRVRVAMMRSIRLPVIVIQAMIRRDVIRAKKDRHVLELLPQGKERRRIISFMAFNGYSRQDIYKMIHVCEGATDEERCRRFLQMKGHKPIWLLHYVIRPSAKLENTKLLRDIISYCEETYDGRRDWRKINLTSGNLTRSRMAMLNMSPETFGHTLQMLAIQAMLLDGRFLMKVAGLAVQYIKGMSGWDRSPDYIYHNQCLLFNAALVAMSPSRKPLPPHWHRSMSHYWEAQKSLLEMSGNLERHLAVSKDGFRAVREVLAGQEKDAREVHNSFRHVQTWPPYLEPGDGIDEMTQPEDNWSRAVSAGTLQQEAGFPLDERDLALDTLQGRAPDGTPTIQQRVIAQNVHPLTVWEASIRATRNATEAWLKFTRPPKSGASPGVHEYAAMFAKLYSRPVGQQTRMRPGDRAFSFPVQEDPNLSEFARMRNQPPSVDELYAEMRRAGIRPRGACLEILVGNAKTLEQAHTYLRDSNEWTWPLMVYKGGGPTARALRRVRTPLVAAYVKLICTIEHKPGRELFRAIRICDKRFEDDDGSRVWASYAWGALLKAMSTKRTGLGRIGQTLTEQVRAYHLVLDKIEGATGLHLQTLVQFGRCLRKAASRALSDRARDLESSATAADSPMTFLYDADSRVRLSRDAQDTAGVDGIGNEHPWLYFLISGSSRIKTMHQALADGEAEVNKLIEAHQVQSLDHMMVRKDAVRARDAYELMAAWAFLGEYEEMASLLEWALLQWDNADLLVQVQSYTDIPEIADFSDVLCIFRRYAEPMLPQERVETLREAVEQAQTEWAWPDDRVVAAFREAQTDPSYQKLDHVLEWTRYRQAKQRGEDPEALLRPPRWQDRVSSLGSSTYSRSGI